MRKKYELIKEFYKNSDFDYGTDISNHFDKIEEFVKKFKENYVYEFVPMLLFSISDRYGPLVDKLLENSEFLEIELTPKIIKNKLIDEEEKHKKQNPDFNERVEYHNDYLSESDVPQEVNFTRIVNQSDLISTDVTNNIVIKSEESCGSVYSEENQIEIENQQMTATQFETSLKDNFGDNSEQHSNDIYNNNENQNATEISNSDTKKKKQQKKFYSTHTSIEKSLRGKFKCTEPDCDNIYENRRYLEKHLLKHHSLTSVQINSIFKEKYGINSIQYHCMICYSIFSYKNNYDAHVKVHGNDGKLTERCSKCFTFWAKTKKEIAKHNMEKHLADSTCPICGKIFVSSIRNHLQTVHNQACPPIRPKKSRSNRLKKSKLVVAKGLKGKFKCSEFNCSAIYTEKKQLERHLITFHKKTIKEVSAIIKLKYGINSSKYYCSVCYSMFSFKNNYLEHLKVHGDDMSKKIRCVICYTFWAKTRDDMMAHNQDHHYKEMFCKLCKKVLYGMRLRAHMRARHPSSNVTLKREKIFDDEVI